MTHEKTARAGRNLRSRRRFLQVSAAFGGGMLLKVVVGARFATAASDLAPKPLPLKKPQLVILNAYVRIEPSGAVRLVMPKVEMGQGTYTSLPMLVAEELEVPLNRVTIEPAPPDPAVYGVNGDQSTGGSTSIRDCWLPLRKAGAAARTMLISAAAQQWRVNPATCRAVGGEVIHEASQRRIGYGALAAAAARLPVPADPALKHAREFRLIGTSVARRDSPDKSSGRATFGIDVQLPNMRIAMIALAPVEGGTVVEPLQPDRALSIAGVRQVVSDRDIVAVVADDTWSAQRGLRALRLQWHDGPNGSVQQAGLIAALEAAAQRGGAVAGQSGNVTAALKSAPSHAEAVYHQPFLAHATMEPMNCTVDWREDVCEIWVGTQAPDRAVAKLAALGLKPEQIRINNHLIGGGFGRRLEVDGIVSAARVARHVRGPVKVIWSREQDVQHDRYRPYYVDRVEAGLDAHGKPVAWRHTIAGSSVSIAWSGEPNKNEVDEDAVTAAADPPYAFENLEVRYVREEPQGVNTSWWRGV
ncbi:MAG: xanthine dehydrogenase family protein molybdopterin-binding subunit, partial [Sinobacteraceae bacterium]|nr:xanthine dehydrogenase family protein molybdopterin-binding subunit [Nevskiaceae bacterium]